MAAPAANLESLIAVIGSHFDEFIPAETVRQNVSNL